jgi:SAM-dependent methyltransferase
LTSNTDIVRLPQDFLEKLWSLEDLYLKHDSPLRRCGFEGGPKRWKAERGPIAHAVDRDGTFMDVGCANGYLLESLAAWVTKERRWHIEPYGVDINPGLVVEAMRRWPGVADHFWVANAWEFAPPLKFDFVYSTADCVPERFLPSYVARLLDRYVKPGGRLIMGAYGDMLWEREPLAIGDVLSDYGFPVAGRMQGGKMLRSDGPVARFTWVAN